jgi:hypothetical protein
MDLNRLQYTKVLSTIMTVLDANGQTMTPRSDPSPLDTMESHALGGKFVCVIGLTRRTVMGGDCVYLRDSTACSLGKHNPIEMMNKKKKIHTV